MTKVRKQKRRKHYRYNINRKRLRNKLYGTGKVACKEIKEAWDPKKSVKTNLEEMGLSYDPNKTIKFGQSKNCPSANITSEMTCLEKIPPTKAYIAQTLENEAKAPRKRMFQLPKSQVQWLTYLISKYGTDFKAMSRDKKNYYQETWKQIRAKIKVFEGIPEQYVQYVKERDSRSTEVK